MGNIKVSVIMPVYNGEEYLEKNLLDLSRQTLEEIEFICVNDGSTDNTLNILKAFKEVFPDKFIIIDSKKNRGAGGARNIGISYARGEYIAFLDSDDRVKHDTYERVYNEAVSDDYDMVLFGYVDEMNKTAVYPVKIKGEATDDVKIKLCQATLYSVDRIYKKELIDSMSMLFRENITYEDTDFCIEAILRTKKVSYVYDYFYYYTYRIGSSSRFDKKDIEKDIRVSRECFKAIKQRVENMGMEHILHKVAYMAYLYISDGLLWGLFSKDDFSYEDFCIFDEIARIIMPEYYKVKFEDDGHIRNTVYNCLTIDKMESYNKLIELKKDILNKQVDI